AHFRKDAQTLRPSHGRGPGSTRDVALRSDEGTDNVSTTLTHHNRTTHHDPFLILDGYRICHRHRLRLRLRMDSPPLSDAPPVRQIPLSVRTPCAGASSRLSRRRIVSPD